MGKNAFDCSLRMPCLPATDLNCSAIGLRQGGKTKNLVQCRWGFFALTALENLSQRLSAGFAAIEAIDLGAALGAFKIDDFTPKSGWKMPNLDFLKGLGSLFLTAMGLATSQNGRDNRNNLSFQEVATFYGQSLASPSAEEVSQGDLASEVADYLNDMVKRLEPLVTSIFSGQLMNGKSLLDIIAKGDWADSTKISTIPDVANQIRIEIISRAVNELWKIGTSNKRWVLFVDLQDDDQTSKCLADQTGPQNLKYCADGGVYYAYNYVEQGDHKGKVDYPWGAEKLQQHGIDMRVRFKPTKSVFSVA